jgi:hypothetical protein
VQKLKNRKGLVMDQKKSTDPIVVRLNVLINLSLEQHPGEQVQTLASRIARLSDMGVTSSDIADIVNKPSSYVSATLATRKTRAKPKV